MKTQVAVATMIVMLVGSWLCPTNKAHGQQRAQRAKEAFSERLEDMNLTDEQETKIAAIRKEFRPKVEKDAKELAGLVQEEVDKVKAVLTAPQRETLKNMKDERAERRAESLAERYAHLEELDLTAGEMTKLAAIRKEYRPKIEKALEGLKGALTDDQRKARAEALDSGKKRSEVIASLKLTAEQKEKMVAVGKEVGPLIREKLEKVRSILDAEQQVKLAELRQERKEDARDHMASAIENFKELNLTDQQKSQIAAIRQEYRPKIHEAGNKARAVVRDELAAIVAVIKG